MNKEAAAWITIRAKYAGTCRHPECYKKYAIGDIIKWRKGYGGMCVEHKQPLDTSSNLKPKYIPTFKDDVSLPKAGGNLPVRVAYGWKGVERTPAEKKTREEWRQEPIPVRSKR